MATPKQKRADDEDKTMDSASMRMRIRQLELDLKLTTDRMLEVSEQLAELKQRSRSPARSPSADVSVVSQLKQTVTNLNKLLADKEQVKMVCCVLLF